MSSNLLSIDDLCDDEVRGLLARARALCAGAAPARTTGRAALFFLEPSLRTRTGFLAAAQRLGWPAPVEIAERRESAISMRESLGDTTAVLAGYFDTLLVRSDGPIHEMVENAVNAVVINAGDRGPEAEHPTQAVIDLFAMEQLGGRIEELTVVLCGDLRMRTSRSLLKLLARHRPARLLAISAPRLLEDWDPPSGLDVEVVQHWRDLPPVDALHVLGIPHGAADEGVRSLLRVGEEALSRLNPQGRIYSPMPVIDEIAVAAREDRRMSFLEQSALGLFVRMAILESRGTPLP